MSLSVPAVVDAFGVSCVECDRFAHHAMPFARCTGCKQIICSRCLKRTRKFPKQHWCVACETDEISNRDWQVMCEFLLQGTEWTKYTLRMHLRNQKQLKAPAKPPAVIALSPPIPGEDDSDDILFDDSLAPTVPLSVGTAAATSESSASSTSSGSSAAAAAAGVSVEQHTQTDVAMAVEDNEKPGTDEEKEEAVADVKETKNDDLAVTAAAAAATPSPAEKEEDDGPLYNPEAAIEPDEPVDEKAPTDAAELTTPSVRKRPEKAPKKPRRNAKRRLEHTQEAEQVTAKKRKSAKDADGDADEVAEDADASA